MGRYITGDINRKLWFAVQSSDAADRFGVTGNQPSTIEYFFDQEDLEKVKTELENIKNTIGEDNIKKLDEFFEKVDGYNDNILMEHNLLEIYTEHIKDYADYLLGLEIEKCITENGSCGFDCEL